MGVAAGADPGPGSRGGGSVTVINQDHWDAYPGRSSWLGPDGGLCTSSAAERKGTTKCHIQRCKASKVSEGLVLKQILDLGACT